ncbi:MAG: hypothetical protein ACKVG0_10400, partial [Alphaproteobacteria bacterium]
MTTPTSQTPLDRKPEKSGWDGDSETEEASIDDALAVENVMALKRVIRMALRYRVRFAIGAISTIVAANFQVLIPQFLGAAVD